ncbi:hypothetical protein JCM14036_15610 [Desulfotomaculum defluvii]
MGFRTIKNIFFINLLMIFLMLTFFPVSAIAQDSDIKGHWAEKQISDWVQSGLAKGYEDGKFKPENNITRAEFMALVNRSFGFTKAIEVNFLDVNANDWFAGDIAKAMAAGYIGGYQDGTMKPNNQITRQEVASIIARLLQLDASTNININNFKDAKDMPQWSRNAIGAVTANGYMGGYADQTFKPIKPITRAEAIVSLDRVTGEKATAAGKTISYTQPGIYGPATGTETIKGNVIISVADVTLQNTTITGDLLLAEGVGDGDVKLKNVKVSGKTIIKGGGANSITLEDCSLPSITVTKEGVRVVASGNTTVKVVQLESGATLVETTTMGPGFETVTLSEVIPATAKVSLTGNFAAVTVAAKEVKVEVMSGQIETLEVAKEAVGATVNVAKDATVNTLTANAAARVTGDGKIETAKVNAANVSIAQTPTKREVASGVTSNIGGQTVSGGTSSSGGGGGGSSTTPKYEVAVSTNPEAGGTVLGGGSYTQGAAVTVIATAKAGYKFVDWTENGSQISTSANYSFTMGTAARILVANFIPTDPVEPSPFTPGEGGSLPDFIPFSSEPGKIGGLYVDRTHRVNQGFVFGGGEVGNYAVVDLEFDPPSKYGANSYTLQYSDDGSTWRNYQHYGEDLTTSNNEQDNFSLNSPAGSYNYRLLVNGGAKNGYTSNEVEVPLSAITTVFTGWGLDESMSITGVIAPYVGSGKEASFNVEKLPDHDGTDLNQYLTYQWYRVNPATFAMTAIEGATDLTYTTTEADAGYLILCRATGDGTNVGGFIQILSHWSPIIANKAYVNNVTNDGFTLNLHKSVAELGTEDIKLSYYDADNNEVIVPIDSITPHDNNAVFEIAAAIPQGVSELYLHNTSDFWRLVSVQGGQHGHMMEGLRITRGVPTDPAADIAVTLESTEMSCPYHLGVMVKNAATGAPITNLVAGDLEENPNLVFNFYLEKGGIDIPLRMVFHNEANDEENEGHYVIYPTDDYRPMQGEYKLTLNKTGYVITSLDFSFPLEENNADLLMTLENTDDETMTNDLEVEEINTITDVPIADPVSDDLTNSLTLEDADADITEPLENTNGETTPDNLDVIDTTIEGNF